MRSVNYFKMKTYRVVLQVSIFMVILLMAGCYHPVPDIITSTVEKENTVEVTLEGMQYSVTLVLPGEVYSNGYTIMGQIGDSVYEISLLLTDDIVHWMEHETGQTVTYHQDVNTQYIKGKYVVDQYCYAYEFEKNIYLFLVTNDDDTLIHQVIQGILSVEKIEEQISETSEVTEPVKTPSTEMDTPETPPTTDISGVYHISDYSWDGTRFALGLENDFIVVTMPPHWEYVAELSNTDSATIKRTGDEKKEAYTLSAQYGYQNYNDYFSAQVEYLKQYHENVTMTVVRSLKLSNGYTAYYVDINPEDNGVKTHLYAFYIPMSENGIRMSLAVSMPSRRGMNYCSSVVSILCEQIQLYQSEK